MPLTTKAKQQLKAKAHALKPIVQVGHQGLTAAVHKEIHRALNDHELIKVRMSSNDRDTKKMLFLEICDKNQAELVSIVGNIGILYRENQEE